jgi:serine/threonine protein kinase
MNIIKNNKNYDKIPFRINFIKELMKGQKIKTMVDFDICDTESYVKKDSTKNIKEILDKEIFDFNKIINQIGGKLLYIKSGTTGHTFKGIMDGENGDYINYAVKIVAYPKKENYGSLENKNRPENAELMMLKTLAYFVVNNQSPHIVLPISTFNTSIKPFIGLSKNKIVNSKKYDQFIKRYKKKEYYDEVSVLISEWANGGDLLDYIRKNYKKMKLRDWRVILFQLLSVLAVIQKKYPSFRHNDLKANNILVHKIEVRNKNNKFKYTINGKNYIIPNIGLQIKLWDFDFACIPGLVENDKVNAKWTSKINVNPEKNRYYDVHYFFNTLMRKGFFPQFLTEKEIPKKVIDFVNRIVPEKFRKGDNIAERGRLLINKEYTTPDKILRSDPFFDKMRPLKDKVLKKS